MMAAGLRYGNTSPETHYVAKGSNPVTQSELLTALDALILQEVQYLSEDDITVTRLAERAKWGRIRAKQVIDKWTKEGKLEYLGKRKENKMGKGVDAWRLIV